MDTAYIDTNIFDPLIPELVSDFRFERRENPQLEECMKVFEDLENKKMHGVVSWRVEEELVGFCQKLIGELINVNENTIEEDRLKIFNYSAELHKSVLNSIASVYHIKIIKPN